MKKIILGVLVSASFLGLFGEVADAKKCVGYCPGVNSDSGNSGGYYNPLNTYVAPYVKNNGQYVQGYTRSTPCKGYWCP